MPVLFACLAIITLVLLAHIIVYRRQVGKLCRQLRFMNENKTMQQPTVDINAKELNELADQIKLMNERLKETEISHLRQDEALRETIANLSHDIRTPLTSLDGYFQLLGSPEITPDKREYYTGIIKSRITICLTNSLPMRACRIRIMR